MTGAPEQAGLVEMAAWRPFGPLRWPTWWRSEMGVDAERRRITYRHVGGITTGMDVLWTIEPAGEGLSQVTIVHEWVGPRWPLVGRAVADRVIGPVFVHGIASRTLAGIAAAAEHGEVAGQASADAPIAVTDTTPRGASRDPQRTTRDQ